MNELILPLSELNDLLITKYFDPYDDYKNLYQVNKHYNELIRNDKLYEELQKFHLEGDPEFLCYNYNSFAKACYYGYVNVVKYLYKKNKTNYDTERAFRYACRNGHFNIVEWLYKITNKK